MRSLALVAGCLLLVGCGNEAGLVTPGAGIANRVRATEPADGATDVAPDAEVVIEFDEDLARYGADTLRVGDAAGELPGTFAVSDDGLTLRWSPDRELPRGHLVTIGPRGGAPIAAFRVRDARQVVERTFQGLRAQAVFAWPSGRRALVTWSGVYELTATRVLPVGVDIAADAFTHGDAAFVYSEYDPVAGRVECVRGDLDGAESRVRTPADRHVVACSARGDAVVFVPNDVAQPTERGLWRLPAEGSQWQWVGPVEAGVGAGAQVAIDGNGNVYAAYARLGQLVVARFAPGTTTAEVFEPEVEDTATGVAFGVADDGVGLLAWIDNTTQRPLRGAWLVPGVGLRGVDVADPTFSFEAVARVSRAGSCHLGYRELNGFGATASGREYARRVEVAGGVGDLENVEQTTALFGALRRSCFEPERGDLWVVDGDAPAGLQQLALWVRRSAPGEPMTAEEPLFLVSGPDRVIRGYHLALDASGRAVLAVNEGPANGVSDTCRVLLLD